MLGVAVREISARLVPRTSCLHGVSPQWSRWVPALPLPCSASGDGKLVVQDGGTEFCERDWTRRRGTGQRSAEGRSGGCQEAGQEDRKGQEARVFLELVCADCGRRAAVVSEEAQGEECTFLLSVVLRVPVSAHTCLCRVGWHVSSCLPVLMCVLGCVLGGRLSPRAACLPGRVTRWVIRKGPWKERPKRSSGGGSQAQTSRAHDSEIMLPLAQSSYWHAANLSTKLFGYFPGHG